MKQVTFRRAGAADFAAVLHLSRQLAEHIEANPPALTPANFDAYFLQPHAPMRLLLAIDAGRAVGMISWTVTHELYSGDSCMYVSDIAVDAAAREQGIGAALMARACDWGRAHNIAKIGWDVWHRNTVARAFYEKLGARADREAIPYLLDLKPWQFRPSRPDDVERLYDLWHASVLATHGFVSESDLCAIRAHVKNVYLPAAELLVAVDDCDRAIGFMGISGTEIESLFIDPAYHRRGLGRAFIENAAEASSHLEVSVNEQNAHAVAFYEALGFAVYASSPHDDDNRPYPLLRMRR